MDHSVICRACQPRTRCKRIPSTTTRQPWRQELPSRHRQRTCPAAGAPTRRSLECYPVSSISNERRDASPASRGPTYKLVAAAVAAVAAMYLFPNPVEAAAPQLRRGHPQLCLAVVAFLHSIVACALQLRVGVCCHTCMPAEYRLAAVLAWAAHLAAAGL